MTLPRSARPGIIRTVPVGRSREPVILVDGALADPVGVVAEAAACHFESAEHGVSLYPGIRADAPDDHTEAIVRIADPLIRAGFQLETARLRRGAGSFSIVTRPPDRLGPLQRVPHIDSSDPHQFALLLFLCGPAHGGTGFYRQSATGIEQVTARTGAEYRAERDRALAEVPQTYAGANTPGYAQTAAFPARFNRLLIYRSFSLHSGLIPNGMPLDPDPSSGRLTINIFLNYRPADRRHA